MFHPHFRVEVEVINGSALRPALYREWGFSICVLMTGYKRFVGLQAVALLAHTILWF